VIKGVVACLLSCVVLAACDRSEKPAADQSLPQTSTASSAHAGDIEWFDGSVESAFAAASAQAKPVFLYWGAQWCPPCYELKAYVFSRADFREKLQHFVPIYLDGDAPSAQRYAETFGVMGYPTVVVLRPDRTEVARISGGMDLSRYADVLDSALDDVSPVGVLLASLQSDSSASLTMEQCRRLAYNGWSLSSQSDAEPARLAAALDVASRRCPAEASMERDRLMLLAVGLIATAERSELDAGKPASKLLTRLVQAAVAKLIAGSPDNLSNADALLYRAEDFFVAVRRTEPAKKTELFERWVALMNALEQDDNRTEPVRLLAVAARLEAAKAVAEDGKIAAPLLADARSSLDAFLSRKYDDAEHVGIVNSAMWVLHWLGDDERMKRMLEEEIRTSKTPYYYMTDLADLEEKAGRKTQAMQWLERAYRESRGPATRFQWGTLYLDGLLRMSPQDHARVESATLQVIGELAGPDRIRQRTRVRLNRLEDSLRRWGEAQPERRVSLAAIANRWKSICASLPSSDVSSKECASMLTI
jgi:thiol-disulfide isomerase/thioredoxin